MPWRAATFSAVRIMACGPNGSHEKLSITQSSAAKVILTGGALAQNIVWQVAGVVDIGTTARMEGRILSLTSITLRTGAVANGRLFAQTAVTLGGNTVVVK